MWKSLRDSLRYHRNKNKSLGKDEDEIDDDWEFKDILSFTAPKSSKDRRKYIHILKFKHSYK